jgi:hypothetical protein
MILKRTIPGILAALLAAALMGAPARAQIGVAGEAKPADAKKDDAKPKKKAAAKAPAEKAGKSKKKKPAADSKYKSRVMAENTESSYRFDSDGNPVGEAAKKKKAAAKAKKSSEDASEEKPDGKDACSAEQPCTNKSSDADAL